MRKTSITALARQQLEIAKNASSGRSAKTVHGGHERSLRQTVVALAAGRTMAEHQNPGESTVYVIHGRILLSTSSASWSGWLGDLIIVPDALHSVEALEDSVILVTVAMQMTPSAAPEST